MTFAAHPTLNRAHRLTTVFRRLTAFAGAAVTHTAALAGHAPLTDPACWGWTRYRLASSCS